ncbi:hypothetical protein CsSME_00011927 [Camellia sinensis var. sinensis]
MLHISKKYNSHNLYSLVIGPGRREKKKIGPHYFGVMGSPTLAFSWPQPYSIPLSSNFTLSSPTHLYLTLVVNRYLREVLIEHHRRQSHPSATSPNPNNHCCQSHSTTPPWQRTIRVMSANKLNVFHWHLTDSQSFPLVLTSEPDLAEKGSMYRALWSSSWNTRLGFCQRLICQRSVDESYMLTFPGSLTTEKGPDLAEKGSYGAEMQYSPKDVKSIVEFGLEHGVRVFPEIGMHGQIVTCANMFWWLAGSLWGGRIAFEPRSDHLNPLNPMAYQVIENVIHDIATMFPESFYHIGANEIVPGCWKFTGNESMYDQPPSTNQGNGGSWCGPFKT